MSELSLADFDLETLSDRSRETLEKIAAPLSDGDRRGDYAAVAEDLGLTTRDVREAMRELQAELDAQRVGARLPQLSHDEFEALKDSILEYGQLVPIVKSKQGTVIDGRHRLRACEEIGRRPWVVESDVPGFDGDLREHELAANVVRRHLTATQRRKAIEAELVHNPKRSDRSIALLFGASNHTVGSARKDLEERGRVSILLSRTSADGRERPATQPAQPEPETRVIAREGREGISFQVAPECVEELLEGISPCRLQLQQIGREYQLVVTML